MMIGRIVIVLMFAALLGVPLLARSGDAPGSDAAARRVVIVSPHNEQIRYEFARAFEAWHEETYGEPATVAWSTPGATGDIRRMLQAATTAALLEGEAVGGNADLVFGGGSYEFNQLKNEIEVTVDGERRAASILAPLDLDPALLHAAYGDDPTIGGERLFDADGYWFGTALSGFGIIYNRDVLAERDAPEPRHWRDLADPRLFGRVAMVDPLISGSVTTAFEAILLRRGWTRGWMILRRSAANARTFADSAPKAPLQVSAGDAAAGVCIDFYGRYQAQAVRVSDATWGTRESELDRLGYLDPPGETVIDPDPIGLLRGAPNEQLARRFVEFTLSPAGQALWQYRLGERERAGGDGLGPRRFELRRMPVRRSFYANIDRFVDQVDPWAIATEVESPNRAVRSFIPLLFDAMAIRNDRLLREAWAAIHEHPAYPDPGDAPAPLVRAEDVTDPTLRRMLELFDELPTMRVPDDVAPEIGDLNDEANLADLKAGWLRGGWADRDLWNVEADPATVLRREFAAFFRDRYERIVRLARGATEVG